MTIRHARGSYPVAYTSPEAALDGFTSRDRLIVDENVARLWPQLFVGTDPFVVSAGEASKCLDTYGRLSSWLAQSRADRATRVFAVGGGVVGDLAGFVAASYMRGVRLLMVPTTLLAMVDSSVGGKVGIDLPEGKNLVGAFWPPAEVRIAAKFLDTLPDRDLLNGSAEVWKYGWILDLDLLHTLEERPLARDERLNDVIGRCIQLKASVVEADEEETLGLRAILNFGHTVGHALEATLAYQGWSHGECISVGMVVEAKIGERLGVTPSGTSDRVRNGLVAQGLPVDIPDSVTVDSLVDFSKRDKKSDGTGVAFSLLTAPGACKLVTGVPETLVRDVLAAS